MFIRVLRTGGFAGIALNAEVDTSQVEPEDRAELERLVDAADYFALPAKIETQEDGFDRFQYEISVEQAGRLHRVACGDSGMSEPLNEMVRHVLRLSRRGA